MFDPNNHVPELSPDDAWGDLDAPFAGKSGAALPPRRIVTRVEPDAPVDGLWIESKPPPPVPSDEVPRLEVQEIGGVLRLAPEKAAPAKISRQAAVKLEGVVPKEEPVRRTEDLSWGQAHPQSYRWLIGAGLGVLLVVVAGLFLLPFINKLGTSKPLEAATMPVFEESGDDLREIERILSSKEEANRILAKYAAATGAEQVIPLVRDGGLLAETIRRKWRPMSVPAGWEVPSEAIWASYGGDGRPYELMAGTWPDHTPFTVFFTRESERLVLDWKATTGFGTTPFEELEKGTGDGTEIRGRLELANFYTFAYPESDFQSFRLAAPAGGSAIWCYTRRGGLADEAAGSLLRAGVIVTEVEKEARVTVSLQRVGTDALPNQWLLAELLHNDWVSP